MTARGRRAGDALRRFPMKVGGGFGPTPPITSGMVFWGNLLSPDTSIVSTAVATLGDSSGNGRHFTQSTAANRPAYNAIDANFGGRPSMTFDGTTQFLEWVSGFPAMASVTMYAVTGSVTVDAVNRRLMEIAPPSVTGGLMFFVPASTNAMRARFDVIPNNSAREVSATMTAQNRFAMVGNLSAGGALWTTYLNGSSAGANITTAAAAGSSSATAATRIGAAASGSVYFFGTATDILIYNAAHTATQVAQVDAWLRWRNGL